MKWESVNLHIEHLLPGLATFVLVARLLADTSVTGIVTGPGKMFLENEFIAGGVFVATAYLLGVVTVVISRCALDRLSEGFPRPFVIRLLSRGQLVNKRRAAINEEYRTKLRAVLASTNEEVKKEVLKRRETGRLVRSSLVPAILAVLVTTMDQPSWLRVVLVLIVFSLILFLYAYAEAMVYEECLLVDI